MCGLVGVFGDLTAGDRKGFSTMLYIDAIRGHHSTGVANLGLNREPLVFKRAVSALDYLDMDRGKKAINTAGCGLIGHNRYATKGAIDNTNAHPFTHGDITGVHNGSLTRQHLLPDHTMFDVDSDNIYHAMNKVGVHETISKIGGAAALVWWNNEEKTLNFWRNDERPLILMESEDGKTIMWASEYHMLLAAVDGGRRRTDNKKWKAAKQLDTCLHTKVSVGEKGVLSTVTEEIADAPKPTYQTQSYGAYQSNMYGGSSANSGLPSVGSSIAAHNFTKPANSAHWEGSVVGDPKVKVRVYGTASADVLAAIAKVGTVLIGKVSSQNSYGINRYVTLRHDSLIVKTKIGTVKGATYTLKENEVCFSDNDYYYIGKEVQFDSVSDWGVGQTKAFTGMPLRDNDAYVEVEADDNKTNLEQIFRNETDAWRANIQSIVIYGSTEMFLKVGSGSCERIGGTSAQKKQEAQDTAQKQEGQKTETSKPTAAETALKLGSTVEVGSVHRGVNMNQLVGILSGSEYSNVQVTVDNYTLNNKNLKSINQISHFRGTVSSIARDSKGKLLRVYVEPSSVVVTAMRSEGTAAKKNQASGLYPLTLVH